MCSLPVWLHILARRGVDPTRMTARARRNEVDVSDLSTDAEFLVFGHFTEDEDDEGFKATRWLPAADVCDLPEFEEKASDLNALLEGVRDSLLPVQGVAQAQAQAF
jgi:hypothetical protein